MSNIPWKLGEMSVRNYDRYLFLIAMGLCIPEMMNIYVCSVKNE